MFSVHILIPLLVAIVGIGLALYWRDKYKTEAQYWENRYNFLHDLVIRKEPHTERMRDECKNNLLKLTRLRRIK